MRLSRPAAAGATAALMLGLIAAPAMAATTDSNFTLTVESNHPDPTDTSFQVGGAGCVADAAGPGTVAVTITDDPSGNGNVAEPQYVMASEDGTWSYAFDLPATLAALAGDQLTDPWFVVAQCIPYSGEATGPVAAEPLYLTQISGDYTLATVGGAQTLTINADGFNPGAPVAISLTPATADGTPVAGGTEIAVGTLNADSAGHVSGQLAAPAGTPDGIYLLSLSAENGEGGYSLSTLLQVSNGVFTIIDMTGGEPVIEPVDGATPVPTTAPTAAATATATVVAAAPAPASGQGQLAKTGANAMVLAIVSSGILAAGIALRARRRA